VFKKNREGILLDHAGHELHEPSNAQLQAAIKYPEKVQEILREESKLRASVPDARSVRDTDGRKTRKLRTFFQNIGIALSIQILIVSCPLSQRERGDLAITA